MADSRDLFEEIMRQPARTGTPAVQPDAAPAGNAALFDDIARQAAPQPAAARGGTRMPNPDVEPATALSSVATGAGDMIHGGAQLLANGLPRSVVDSVNDAMAWVNRQPVIGPATRALGMTPATPEQVNEGVAQREADYQEARRRANPPTMSGLVTGERREPGTDWWRMGGQVAASLPAAALAPAAGSLPAALGYGAASGAVLGAAQPVPDATNFWDEKATQALIGGGTGAAGGLAGHMVGRLVGGARNVNPNVQALHDAGVRLTPGQITGGLAQRVENAATSLPVVGDVVLGAQRRGLESFNRAVANRVLEPLGQAVDEAAPVGRELVDDVGSRIGAAYQSAASRAQPFRPDAQFAQDLQAAGQQFMTPASRQTFLAALQDRIVSRFQQGPIDGDTFKVIDSELGQIARSYSGSAQAAEREIGDAMRGVQQAMRGLMARTNPQIAPEIRAADAAYARFVRMRDAAGSAGAVEGVFSPAQFSRGVQRGDASPARGAFARGDALMQDLSDSARAVMPSTIPDSGTTTRAAILTTLLGGSPLGGISPAAALPAAAITGAYTSPGQRLIQGALLGRRPGAVRALGGAIEAGGAPVSVPLGGLLLGPPEDDRRRRGLLD